MLTRVAASHIRIGTFELLAAREDREGLAILASYALQRHYPKVADAPPGTRTPDAKGPGSDALGLLEQVVQAQASLVARWLAVGFVHGVMNTDNTSIAGETIDYGPCAFLDEYDANKTFSSIDHAGRYAYWNQPRIAQWNLARLGEALLPLLATHEDEAIRLATDRIERFSIAFATSYTGCMRAKLGLVREDGEDPALVADLLDRMASNEVDYTIFFRRLCAAARDPAQDARIASLFAEPAAFHDWSVAWRRRLEWESVAPDARAAAMRSVNPAFIPRNHRIAQAIDAAVQRDDLEPFETLVRVLGQPYEDQPEVLHLADPPRLEERVLRTFCGT